MASTNPVLLDGARNFRDIGGVPGHDGRRLRSGLVFRSNRLSQLSPDDHIILRNLELRAVFDLRSRSEREEDPTLWHSDTAATHVFSAGHKRRLIDMAADYPRTKAGSLALMHDFYREMPVVMGHAFSAMLVGIASGGTPCVIHCSAGKDRTGVAIAILLAALGVPRGEIIADYARSSFIPGLREDMIRAMTGEAGRRQLIALYPADALAATMDAAPSYIEAALDAIDDRYGSIDAFLEKIGVSPGVVASLRSQLLEAANASPDAQCDSCA